MTYGGFVNLARFKLGEIYLFLGWFEKAREIFNLIVRANPRLDAGWNNLGVAHYQKWCKTRDSVALKEAKIAFERAIDINPICSDALSNLGNLFDDLGELIKAEEILRKAVEVTPDHADACCNLGMVLHKQNNLEEAVTYYKQAIRSDPEHANAWCNLGEAYRELYLLDEALKATHRALEINPRHPQALSNLERLKRLVNKTTP